MRVCPHCHVVFTTSAEFCAIDGNRVIESEVDPLIGASFDRYTILERLGEGGMAVVYRARHQVLEREYAIKILFGELASDTEFAERFRREAQASSRLDHPNVVKVSDFGTTPEGATFLIMELLVGRSLAKAIQFEGAFEPAHAASVLREVAIGLSAAHQAGLVHRDLKPQNVMLVESDGRERAKILDFGLVRMPDVDRESPRLTRTGATLGTPYYIAPEIIMGEPATDRSDLYSLGAMLYEMLSGVAPFVGSVPEILVKHATEQAPELPKAKGLERIAKQLLSKNPELRFESAEAVITALDKLMLIPVEPPPRRATSDPRAPIQPLRRGPSAANAAAGNVTLPARPLVLDNTMVSSSDEDETVIEKKKKKSEPAKRASLPWPTRMAVIALAAVLALVVAANIFGLPSNAELNRTMRRLRATMSKAWVVEAPPKSPPSRQR